MVNTHVFRSKLLASKRKNPFYCVLDSCCGEVRDLSEEKLGMEKSGDYLNYPSSNISLDWRFGSGNLISPPTCLVPTQNAIAVYGMDPINTSPSSSISMADSFSSTVWDHPSSQNLEFCTNSNIQTSASTTNVVSSRNMGSGSLSSVAMEKVLNFGWNPPNSVPNADVFLQTGTAVLFGWNPPNSVPNADVFLQTGTAVLSQNSTQFPTDSPFIEWAARFSCFNSGDFTNVVNPIRISEHLNPYSKGVGIQMLEVPLNNGLDAVSGAQSQKNGSQMTDVVRDYMPVDNGMLESRLTKNGGESGGLLVSSDEGKGGTGALNNEADEPEFGISVQGQFVSENAGGEPPARALGAKKRKTSSQMDIELDQSKGSPHLSVETVKENVEPKQNGEKNAATIAAKTIGKHSKGGCQKSDAPKEDYIHVRARRGQATNSHSLAERVRREKISERMKYLQDLVPGCSKVTGKAVMLDEIINYVQSLQRQVEVMTMKLAVVNPRLDFNIEALLSKDIFQSQGSTPPTLGFLPDMGMAHPQLHPLQHGFIQVASPSIGNHSDFLRRTSNSQLTPMNRYEEPAPQIKNAWNDELHNVVQMSYSDNGPFNTQELNGSLPPGHMKVELRSLLQLQPPPCYFFPDFQGKK